MGSTGIDGAAVARVLYPHCTDATCIPSVGDLAWVITAIASFPGMHNVIAAVRSEKIDVQGPCYSIPVSLKCKDKVPGHQTP